MNNCAWTSKQRERERPGWDKFLPNHTNAPFLFSQVVLFTSHAFGNACNIDKIKISLQIWFTCSTLNQKFDYLHMTITHSIVQRCHVIFISFVNNFETFCRVFFKFMKSLSNDVDFAISCSLSNVTQIHTCNSSYLKLDDWIMHFKCFHWLSHHEL